MPLTLTEGVLPVEKEKEAVQLIAIINGFQSDNKIGKVTKASFYQHFKSKDDLCVEFFKKRHKI